MYLDEYEETPWDALKYLIAGVNYGGHVTDDLDRRLLHTYINDFFNENVLNVPFYKLSSLNDTYYVPKDGERKLVIFILINILFLLLMILRWFEV